MVLIKNTEPRPDLALAVMQETAMLDQFVAQRVFPTFETKVSTAPIPKVMARRRVERLHRPRHGGYPRSPLTVEDAGTFKCEDSGFEEPLDSFDVETLGGEAIAEEIASLKAAQSLFIAKDAALAASLMTTTTFGAGYNDAVTAGANWADAAAKPIDDVIKAAEKVRLRTGVPAYMQKVLISGGLYAKLIRNAQVQSNGRAILGYTDKNAGIAALISVDLLATILGVGEVIIAGGVKNTADEGLAESLASVWDDTKALVFVGANPADRLSTGLGRTFVWNDGQVVAYGASGTVDAMRGLIIESYDESKTNLRILRARQNLDMLMLNKDAGHLITGA